jgi:hypothetical protein
MARFRPGHLDRLLPLLMVYFDGQTKKLEMRERDLRRYSNRVAAPLPHRTARPFAAGDAPNRGHARSAGCEG